MSANLIRKAPFISYLESPDVELEFKLEKLADGGLDRLVTGSSTKETVFFNRSNESFGVVCGSMIEDVETVVKRLIASHLKDSSNHLLILHTDNGGLANPFSLLDFATGPGVKAFISPRNPKSVASIYLDEGRVVSPLQFDEATISLHHVLAIFTPPDSLQSGSKILNLVHYVISQLTEPFDLQRFNDLVNKEVWDEEGQTFMAMRQTLLTMLLSASSAWPDSLPSQRVIVDLSDPILSGVSLDHIMMDMALQQFLISSSGGRKMIVVNAAQEYLKQGTLLARHLHLLGSLGNQRSTSVILVTTEPPIDSTICDYVFLTRCETSLWIKQIQRMLLQSDELGTKPSVSADEVILFSPISVRVRGQSSLGAAGGRWGLNSVTMNIGELASSTTYVVEPPIGTVTLDLNTWENSSIEDEAEPDTPALPPPLSLHSASDISAPAAKVVEPPKSNPSAMGGGGRRAPVSSKEASHPSAESKIRSLLAELERSKQATSSRPKTGNNSSSSRNVKRRRR